MTFRIKTYHIRSLTIVTSCLMHYLEATYLLTELFLTHFHTDYLSDFLTYLFYFSARKHT